MIRFIIGVVLGHILCFFIIYVSDFICFSTEMYACLNIGLGLTISGGYLLYIYKIKQISTKWFAINKWLAPVFITIGVLQWFPCMLLASRINVIGPSLLFPLTFLYFCRITFLIESFLIGYIYHKVNIRLSSLSSEE